MNAPIQPLHQYAAFIALCVYLLRLRGDNYLEGLGQ